jgi:hypothetical protein
MPLITVLLIIFGFSNLQVYYSYFNINIIHYISVTEILLSFLPLVDSAAKVLFLVVILVLTAAIEVLIKKSAETLKWEEMREAAESTWWADVKELFSRKTYARKWHKVIIDVLMLLLGIVMKTGIFLIAVTGVLAPIYLIRTNNPLYVEAFGFFGFLWVLGVFYLLVQNEKILSKQLDTLGNQLLSKYNLPFMMIFIAASLSVLYQYKRGIQVSQGREEEKVAFIYQDKLIRSAKDTLYIGRTQSVLFLRQPSTKKVFIYPVEDVTNLQFTKVDSVPVVRNGTPPPAMVKTHDSAQTKPVP